MMYYYGSGWGTPHMYNFGFSFVQLIFWLFLIFIMYKVLKKSGHSMHWPNMKDPVDILKERYARGEITKEQFESMKKDLKE